MLAHVRSSAPDFSSFSFPSQSASKPLPKTSEVLGNAGTGEPWEKKPTLDDLQSYRKSNKQIVAVGPVGRASGFKPITKTLMWHLAQSATFSYLLPCIAFSRRSFVNNEAGARALERIREGIWTRSVLPRECIFFWWRWNQQRYHQNNVTCHRSNGTLFAIV